MGRSTRMLISAKRRTVIKSFFDALKAQDFEGIIKHLQDAATVVEVYRPKRS